MIEPGHWQLKLDHCFVLFPRLWQLYQYISSRSTYLPCMLFNPGSQCYITPVAVAAPPDVCKCCHCLDGW